MQALVLNASPRRDGNASALAAAAVDGLTEAGHAARLVHADAILGGFLRDCRQCRTADGGCAIDDGFAATFHELFLPADGFIAATPVYWYGMAGQLKAFFDRMFCYVAASYPRSGEVVAAMQGKRIGLLVSAEETFPTVAAGIVHQVQEFSRYTHSTFVGWVQGAGNARGEIARDPSNPLARARRFGRDLFTAHASDYCIDTPRSARVWDADRNAAA